MPDADEITHQQTLLTTYRRTLAIELNQRAAHGAAYTPPGTIGGIIEARDNIARIKSALRGWGINVRDDPNDEEPPARSMAEQLAQPERAQGQMFIFSGNVQAGVLNTGRMDIKEATMSTGDSFNFEGANLSGSNNNFKSTLTNVTQSIGALPNLDGTSKQQIEQLLKQLGVELEKVPKGSEGDAEAVEEMAKELLEKAAKEKPNQSLVSITAEGLKKAAENIKAVLPTVLPIATQIATLILSTMK